MSTIIRLFAWMPLPLYVLCAAVVGIFFLVVVLRIIALIKDIVPFL